IPEWRSIEGAPGYRLAGVANDERARWLGQNRRTYTPTGKMTEKYDVADLNKRAGGGEYATQDGFGWTNGVALALSAQEPQVPAVRDRGTRRAEAHRVSPRALSRD